MNVGPTKSLTFSPGDLRVAMRLLRDFVFLGGGEGGGAVEGINEILY